MKGILIFLLITGSLSVFGQTAPPPYPTRKSSSKLDCTTQKAIIILNNKKLPCDSLEYIKPEGIEDIQVLDSTSATKLYGNAGSYGALIITMKSYAAIQRRNKKQKDETKKP